MQGGEALVSAKVGVTGKGRGQSLSVKIQGEGIGKEGIRREGQAAWINKGGV